ncbi:MAG: GNAT family N-acetyltransferase [Edaphobacter sp.]|uniref:GNAT family N-acetyltransferase n=1 Tax=Edaphobacter sp. TaxID=1934404 RepID=UPI0023A39BEA|nr:GNAT family N-acetyltransferase [Edaphobacter sp.]MDE1174997.1 GNAT family N-acetyltransferase [Edaphobacter sp.]
MNDQIVPVEPGELCDRDLSLILESFGINQVHRTPTYQFQMRRTQTGETLGTIRLRIGSSEHIHRYAGHIGYSVLPEHRGHRMAARSVLLLTPLAAKLEIDPLWITCDPENMASRRSLELAGAEFVEIVEVPSDCIIHQSGHPKKCRYRLSTGDSAQLHCGS